MRRLANNSADVVVLDWTLQRKNQGGPVWLSFFLWNFPVVFFFLALIFPEICLGIRPKFDTKTVN